MTRTVNGEQHECLVTIDLTLTASDAAIRLGTLSGGMSQMIRFPHAVSQWTLREIDAALTNLVGAARAEMTPAPAPPVYRSVDRVPPPRGYAWCPACLGCLERSQTCATCDGNRIVRTAD